MKQHSQQKPLPGFSCLPCGGRWPLTTTYHHLASRRNLAGATDWGCCLLLTAQARCSLAAQFSAYSLTWCCAKASVHLPANWISVCATSNLCSVWACDGFTGCDTGSKQSAGMSRSDEALLGKCKAVLLLPGGFSLWCQAAPASSSPLLQLFVVQACVVFSCQRLWYATWCCNC